MNKEVIRNTRKSPECGCVAKFDFSAESGVIFDGAHAANCLPLTEKEFQREGYVMKILKSPDKQIEFEDFSE